MRLGHCDRYEGITSSDQPINTKPRRSMRLGHSYNGQLLLKLNAQCDLDTVIAMKG